jgi:hypothetical protein
VAKVFKATAAARKTFVVYSDMLQNSESLCFYKAGTKLRSDDLLAVTEKAGLLADWPGVEVYVAARAAACPTPRRGAWSSSGGRTSRRVGRGCGSMRRC